MTRRGVTFEELCAIALALPGVERGSAYGTPALRVKGKFLLRLREDGESVALRIDLDAREILLRADPEAFFLTEHYAAHPAILVRLSAVTREALTDVLEQAWEGAAPKPRRAKAGGSPRLADR